MHGLVLLRLYTLDSRKSQTCDLVADKGRHVVRGTRGRSGVEAANSACGTYARCARAPRHVRAPPLGVRDSSPIGRARGRLASRMTDPTAPRLPSINACVRAPTNPTRNITRVYIMYLLSYFVHTRVWYTVYIG